MTGDDLCDFVDQKLFPYLHGFTQKAAGSNTIEYKIGQIFGEIRNKISSGYNLREIIDHIDELRFRSQVESTSSLPSMRALREKAFLTENWRILPINHTGSRCGCAR
jgi:hypothetical protein